MDKLEKIIQYIVLIVRNVVFKEKTIFLFVLCFHSFLASLGKLMTIKRLI